ncbi:hypothetical protein VNO78_20564 [Psophocarpus tetragonolobus]|uniref:MADS-box domain-containing protein n=1 Tax=Psophocarpus tetragonolobus TaxID=3891 RepID=A0AAN9S9M7_PSOTE
MEPFENGQLSFLPVLSKLTVTMTRKKVKLGYISDAAARKATYKKRKKGILKKVSELTILCGIPACAIISSPFDSKPDIWPDPEGARQVIQKYLDASVVDESKNVNQESYIMQKIAKAQDQLKKLHQENHEKEMTLSMFKYMHGQDLPNNVEELRELKKMIEKNMWEVESKSDVLNFRGLTSGSSDSMEHSTNFNLINWNRANFKSNAQITYNYLHSFYCNCSHIMVTISL